MVGPIIRFDHDVDLTALLKLLWCDLFGECWVLVRPNKAEYGRLAVFKRYY